MYIYILCIYIYYVYIYIYITLYTIVLSYVYTLIFSKLHGTFSHPPIWYSLIVGEIHLSMCFSLGSPRSLLECHSKHIDMNGYEYVQIEQIYRYRKYSAPIHLIWLRWTLGEIFRRCIANLDEFSTHLKQDLMIFSQGFHWDFDQFRTQDIHGYPRRVSQSQMIT